LRKIVVSYLKIRLLSFFVFLCGAAELAGQELQIGIIEFYGLGRVPEGEARGALTVKVGDTISFTTPEFVSFKEGSERRLSSLPGVANAHVAFVCCDAGRAIVYAGIEEKGRTMPTFRAAPNGKARLAADIVQAAEEFFEALKEAVVQGSAAEDDSQGHALSSDPSMRAVQERFAGYAARDLTQLRHVLRHSSDAEQRALAAHILGYVSNKQDVVVDLVFGIRDTSPEVRNNAMRALAVFASMTPISGRPKMRVPYEPFIPLLHSLVWTDRNKASFALDKLSERRDPKLLAKLRREAMTPLIEMAHWKSGHAKAPLMILGRIGGQSEDAIQSAWTRGDRDAIINAALKQH
jgi:hypothetical protein